MTDDDFDQRVGEEAKRQADMLDAQFFSQPSYYAGFIGCAYFVRELLRKEITGLNGIAAQNFETGMSIHKENEELKNWKREMHAVTLPIFRFQHPEMKLGESRITFILSLAKERDALKKEIGFLKVIIANLNGKLADKDLLDKEAVELGEQRNEAMRERNTLRKQCEAMAMALQQIMFDRGTNAGSTNAKNYTIAREAHVVWQKFLEGLASEGPQTWQQFKDGEE